MLYALLSLVAVAVSASRHTIKRPHKEHNLKETCLDANIDSVNFTSQNHELQINGMRFDLKAASWFGFETSACVVHGLWSVSADSIFEFLVENNFNGIRLPFCAQVVLENPMPDSINYDANPELVGLSSLEIMDWIVLRAMDYGLLIMLDMHSLEEDGLMQDGLWYDDAYPQDTVMQVWMAMVSRYGNYWNVIAADCFNEPFDATWGDGSDTDFMQWCTTLGNAIHENGANWLINVEGIANGCPDACFYGENLMDVVQSPVKLNAPHKVIYSPHVYGPDVYQQSYFNDPNFPNNMPAIWSEHWGYINNSTEDSVVIIGEWGGSTDGQNGVWMDAIIQYMDDIGQTSQFFWCVNPDSGDTGGLLEDDWVTPVEAKLDKLQTLMPNPTSVVYNNQTAQVCFGTQ